MQNEIYDEKKWTYLYVMWRLLFAGIGTYRYRTNLWEIWDAS